MAKQGAIVTSWKTIPLAIIILIASVVGAAAQSADAAAASGNDSGVLPLAYEAVGHSCSEIWAATADTDVVRAAATTVKAASVLAADYWDAANADLAAVAQAQDEYDQTFTELTAAYTAAFSAGLKAGLDYADVPRDDPVARKKFFAATHEGLIALDLEAKRQAIQSRLDSAEAKSYLMLAKYSMAIEAAREVRACAEEQRARLTQSASAPPQSTTAATGPSPVGSWRYVRGQEGMTLTISGGPQDYAGTVGIDTLGSSASGTLTIRKQSEGIFAGSMTFGNNISGVKITVAPDGTTLALTGNSVAAVTFTLQK